MGAALNSRTLLQTQVPGAEVGIAHQTINLKGEKGTLISEVELEVLPFPGLPGAKGAVVTACNVRTLLTEQQDTYPRSNSSVILEVTVESTRVSDSNVAGSLLDGISVPVQTIFEALRGDGATRVKAEVTYLDQDIRITRTLPSREVFVYRRLE